MANLLPGLGVDNLLARSESGPTSTVLPDALGSTVALADGSGTIQTEYTYEPFGAATVTGSSSSNAFQYTGREHDGTGLMYYRARYYDPVLQRFISEDPIGFSGGDANLYAYVWNSPTNLVDPLGLEGAVPNANIEISLGPDGVSLNLRFDVEAPPGTDVSIDVGQKIVFEEGGNFSNTPFVQLPDGNQTGTTNELGIATFDVNITNTSGYINIDTPGLNDTPTVLTGPVGNRKQLKPCKYYCRTDKSYQGPGSNGSLPPGGGPPPPWRFWGKFFFSWSEW